MEKFHMFDDRIYQMTKSIKATDRIIYTVMMNEQKYYVSKGQHYTPSYAHLGQYAGISRTSVIECMKRLEKHGLIEKTNIASNQCIIKVYSLDEVPEVLTELTAKEARKAKLDSKLTESVKKVNSLSQESLPTESRNLTQSVKKLDTYNNGNNKKELINNTEEDFKEESLKSGASLCDSHKCDSLGIEETDLDDLEVSSKKTTKREDKISDVNEVSDQKDTPCPRLESTDDDELPDVDLDDEEDPEEELKREQHKAEKRKRFELAKLKNKINELDDFDDSDGDDFAFTPRKKTHTEPKKEKIKVRRVYAGGMH
ncbi:helix-turn-helix domain-containing protein [Citrobacter freundii]|uniref:helix-turn-helix domain-containing protein n=1 Tax=Citrobacter freundii TaxID=546 RepID=UPI0012302297|nr:helix-turn-helix domain-containing protein [Citrobacter freundii]KAA3565180.1 helix-turn-helix domain-containing protein [Citrobacter freundii]MDV0655566.1 helix-turn-helix domain-containing protein [Citrobacter freundii]MDV0721103.1 helix-turn-helix domain-containing protein [Citrobacter freundii]MEB0615884.1 helix-turn-helix domain-containing protein [Citrobacter freundii]MEB0691266.1 helix-turn-helix domain-containing protein [Citrobacter freundii]